MIHPYAFFAIPPDNTFSQLETIIDQYGKQFQTLTYPPHLTLMHEVEGEENEIIAQVEAAAAHIQPFMVTTGKVEFSTTFFQCVFVRVNTTAELVNAHLSLKTALKSQKHHVFMPHISLVYGNFDIQLRAQICQEINLPSLNFMVDQLVITTLDPSDSSKLLTISKIHL